MSTSVSQLFSRFLSSEPSPWANRTWYAWAVLASALGFTLSGGMILDKATSQAEQERFAVLAAGAQIGLARRLEVYSVILRGVAGAVESGETLDRHRFSIYAKNLNLPVDHPGLNAVGWCSPVPADDEPQILRWLAAQGYAQPHLWPDSALAPGDHHSAVLLVEPGEETHPGLIGFDLTSDSACRAAMNAAYQERVIRASEPLTLLAIGSSAAQPGFAIFHPLFSTTDPRQLRGYAFACLASTALFDELFKQQTDRSLAVTITDLASGKLVYDTAPVLSSQYTQTGTLAFLGRSWKLDFRSTPYFVVISSRTLEVLFCMAGSALSLGLFVLARSQAQAVLVRAQLYRTSLTAKREAELILQINHQLASTRDPHTVAQAVTNAGRELTEASFGCFFTLPPDSCDLSIFALTGQTPAQFSPTWLLDLIQGFRTTLANQDMVRINEIQSPPSLVEIPGVISYLAVHVRARGGELIGGLLFAHPQAHHFSLDHERLLTGLATQAAIAFDHAKLFEAEREATRIAANRANDLSQANAELQQFVYVSSHDLQEPLRTITQYLDLLRLRSGGQLDEKALRYVTYAAESASRMYILLNDLLTYSRLGYQSERHPVSLNEVVDEVLQDLRLIITETKAVITINDNLPVIRCDRAKIRSLFQNLIGNALKFRREQIPLITLSATVDSDMCRVMVEDNGIGILPEHRLAIFAVFHRLHDRESFPGTGIGLAICRKVVEQHGGRIWTQETPGGGATFLFSLTVDGSGAHPIVADS